ncbi:MAG TPA: hypothetical protein VGL80_11135, partial [Pseudonocardiaceae bacterium]
QGADVAIGTGLREAPITGPDQPAADACLAELGLARSKAFEFGADVAVTPREVLTGSLGNPFRWTPAQDLSAIPKIVTEALAEAGIDPDAPVLRDRTIRYRTYRRAK